MKVKKRDSKIIIKTKNFDLISQVISLKNNEDSLFIETDKLSSDIEIKKDKIVINNGTYIEMKGSVKKIREMKKIILSKFNEYVK